MRIGIIIIIVIIFVYYNCSQTAQSYSTNIRHAGRKTTATTQGSTMHRRVKPAKLLPHTAHSDWINRTGLTSWAFTRCCDRHTSDKVAHYSIYRPRKDERLSWPWVAGYRDKVPPPGVEPGNVTHPSTNRARRRVTSLIRPTPLPLGLRHATSHWYESVISLQYHWLCVAASIMPPMRKPSFWKKMLCSENVLLCLLTQRCKDRIFALADKFHIRSSDV